MHRVLARPDLHRARVVERSAPGEPDDACYPRFSDGAEGRAQVTPDGGVLAIGTYDPLRDHAPRRVMRDHRGVCAGLVLRFDERNTRFAVCRTHLDPLQTVSAFDLRA